MQHYLQLDVTRPAVGKHARMALRMHRPFGGELDDPWNLSDQAALEQLERFAKMVECPRLLQKRYECHNRVKRSKAQKVVSTTSWLHLGSILACGDACDSPYDNHMTII